MVPKGDVMTEITERAQRPMRQTVGAFGEDLAVRYLTDRGLEVIDRNWRCRLGEIDVVALAGRDLVVCEVKTRRSLTVGDPLEAVGHRKVARLRGLTAGWLRAHPSVHPEGVRIDAIGILLRQREPSLLRHVVGVTR